MKYWAYINEEVVGPFEEDKLNEVKGLTKDTMVCPEAASEGEKQKWLAVGELQQFKPEQKDIPNEIPNGEKMQEEKENIAPSDRMETPEGFPDVKLTEPIQKEDVPVIDPVKKEFVEKAEEKKQMIKEEVSDAAGFGPVEKEELKEPLSDEKQQFENADIPDIKKKETEENKPYPAVDINFEEPISAEKSKKVSLSEEKNIEQRLFSIENTLSEITSIVNIIAEKINAQESSINEVRVGFLKNKSEQMQAQITPKKTASAHTYQTIQEALEEIPAKEKTAKSSSKPDITQGVRRQILKKTPSKGEAHLTISTKIKKTSTLVKMFRMFFILIFILVLTSGVFVFLTQKKILPQFLNPLNYILPQKKADITTNVFPTAEIAASENIIDEETLLMTSEIKDLTLKSGKTLQQAVLEVNPNEAAGSMMWNVQKMDSDLYSVVIRNTPAPGANWGVSYRFDYNKKEKTLIPTNSEAQNILNM